MHPASWFDVSDTFAEAGLRVGKPADIPAASTIIPTYESIGVCTYTLDVSPAMCAYSIVRRELCIIMNTSVCSFGLQAILALVYMLPVACLGIAKT